jgi:hypothetical protein
MQRGGEVVTTSTVSVFSNLQTQIYPKLYIEALEDFSEVVGKSQLLGCYRKYIDCRGTILSSVLEMSTLLT